MKYFVVMAIIPTLMYIWGHTSDKAVRTKRMLTLKKFTNYFERDLAVLNGTLPDKYWGEKPNEADVRSASDFFSNEISWLNSKYLMQKGKLGTNLKFIAFPDELSQLYMDDKLVEVLGDKNWLSTPAEKLKGIPDIRWVRNLKHFDSWILMNDEDSEIDSVLKQVPALSSIRLWARAFMLIRKYQKRDDDGVKRVSHLKTLLLRSGNPYAFNLAKEIQSDINAFQNRVIAEDTQGAIMRAELYLDNVLRLGIKEQRPGILAGVKHAGFCVLLKADFAKLALSPYRISDKVLNSRASLIRRLNLCPGDDWQGYIQTLAKMKISPVKAFLDYGWNGLVQRIFPEARSLKMVTPLTRQYSKLIGSAH